MKRKIAIACLAALSLGGCTVGDASDQGEASAAIVGGSTDNGDPSVVALFAAHGSSGEGALCTASVIAPTVLVTAAHCVAPAEVGSDVRFTAILGTDWAKPSAPRLAVAATHYDPAFDPSNLTGGHDIGVVILAQATTLPPLPFNRASDRALPGSARLVGYGVSDGEQQRGAGIKRTVVAPIEAVGARLLQIGDSKHDTCQGDSGGPALVKLDGVETIVGLTSFGRAGCRDGGFDTRIDRYSTFLDRFIGTSER